LNGISERIKHVRIDKGFCLICGVHGKLTKDHVPPKGSITIEPVEQRHIAETMNGKPTSLKGIKANHGSTFKTICQSCNSDALGGNDSEVTRVYSDLTQEIRKNHFQYNGNYNVVKVNVNAEKYTRAMIGHILSATSSQECKREQVDSSYFTPLKNYVLGDINAINESHDIYYWFYPFRRHLSAKMVAFHNEGNNCTLSLLSFFPLAFLLTEKGKGIYPAHSRKLELTDTELTVDLSPHNAKYIEFPFCELRGNQFRLNRDYQCITSYPIKNR
jgi:hypothetical protein